MAVQGEYLWISAPSAGGMVRIDLGSDESTVLPLDSLPGPFTVHGDVLIVVAYREWQAEDEHSPAVSKHPVDWAAPGNDEVPEPLAVSADRTGGAQPRPADVMKSGDIDLGFDVARPVWRVDPTGATRVDLGGDVTSVVSLDDDAFVAVVRRADQSVVLTQSGTRLVSAIPRRSCALDSGSPVTC